MKHLLLWIMLSSLILTQMPATKPSSKSSDQNADSVIDRGDELSLGEGPITELVRERYERIDMDDDGVITAEEYNNSAGRLYSVHYDNLQQAHRRLLQQVDYEVSEGVRVHVRKAAETALREAEALKKVADKERKIVCEKLPLKYVDVPVVGVIPLDPERIKYRSAMGPMLDSMRKNDSKNEPRNPFFMDNGKLFSPDTFKELYPEEPTTKPQQ